MGFWFLVLHPLLLPSRRLPPPSPTIIYHTHHKTLTSSPLSHTLTSTTLTTKHSHHQLSFTHSHLPHPIIHSPHHTDKHELPDAALAWHLELTKGSDVRPGVPWCTVGSGEHLKDSKKIFGILRWFTCTKRFKKFGSCLQPAYPYQNLLP